MWFEYKKIIANPILYLILIILLVGGCTGGTTTKVPEIYKGTDGLTMDFLQDTPPKEVYENQRFLLVMKMENKGPIDIRDGVVAVGVEDQFVEITHWEEQGHDMDLTTLDNFRASFDIDGTTIDRPTPRQGIVVVHLIPNSLDGQLETHTSDIRATVCYPYQTILSQEVCIESDIFDMHSGVKVCTSEEQTLSSQGSPLAVTKIQPTMMPNEDGTLITPHFRFTIKNSGKGTVISQDAAKSCSSQSLSRDDFNEVAIKAKLFDTTLDCLPDEVELDENGEAEFTCELSSGVEANQDAYKSILVVELDYGYSFTKSDSFEIKKIK